MHASRLHDETLHRRAEDPVDGEVLAAGSKEVLRTNGEWPSFKRASRFRLDESIAQGPLCPSNAPAYRDTRWRKGHQTVEMQDIIKDLPGARR